MTEDPPAESAGPGRSVALPGSQPARRLVVRRDGPARPARDAAVFAVRDEAGRLAFVRLKAREDLTLRLMRHGELPPRGSRFREHAAQRAYRAQYGADPVATGCEVPSRPAAAPPVGAQAVFRGMLAGVPLALLVWRAGLWILH